MKIVSLAPGVTEILYTLGFEEQIIGVSENCDFPEEAQKKSTCGNWVEADWGKIEQMKPDIIFTYSFAQRKIKNDAEEKGFKVVHIAPKTLEQVFQSISLIGRSLGREDKANALVEGMKSKMLAIQGDVEGERKKKVYIEEWGNPPTAAGRWIPKLIEMAGGIPLSKEGDDGQPVLFKHIKEFNPEFMIVAWKGTGDSVDIEGIKKREGWGELDFVRKDKIIVIDDALLHRPGPRLVDGLIFIGKTINPGKF